MGDWAGSCAWAHFDHLARFDLGWHRGFGSGGAFKMAELERGGVAEIDGSLTLSRDIRRACQLLEKLQVRFPENIINKSFLDHSIKEIICLWYIIK